MHTSPLLTVYLYLLIFITFFLLYQDLACNQHLQLLADLHNRSTDSLRKVAFLIVLLTLLGTPVTLGFVYKLTVLRNLSSSAVFIALIINLIMLIFYLQAARHPRLSRKKRHVLVTNNSNVTSRAYLILSLLFTVGALTFAPLFIDISMVFLN